MKKSTSLILAVLFYILSTGASFSVFRRGPNFLNSNKPSDSQMDSDNPVEANLLLDIDPNEPKTEICPLNGKLYTKTEQQAWEKRRPLIIMVENSPDARPHSGIIRADIVYEAVAEGGVTRFMPVFYCDAQRSAVTIAPVRSVRVPFIDWASEYGETPLFGHVGGANCSADKLPSGQSGPCKTDPRAQAIEILSKIGWRYGAGNDLDQFSVGAKAYIRNETRLGIDHPVATEHSVEGNTEKLWLVGADRGWTNLDPDENDWTDDFRPWKFKEDAPEADRGSVTTIAHDFWSGYKQFDVRWEYDPSTNMYKRFTGGQPHTDLETGNQIVAKNVVVQLAEEIGPVDDLKHMLYTTIDEGDAYIFQDGQAIEGYWQKNSRTGRTLFFTKKRQEVTFNPGAIWISVVSQDTKVSYDTPASE